MTAREFRITLKAQPFRPFLVKTTDEDTHVVEHPDYALVSPANTEVVVYEKDGHFRHIAMNHIVSLEPVREAAKRSGRR